MVGQRRSIPPFGCGEAAVGVGLQRAVIVFRGKLAGRVVRVRVAGERGAAVGVRDAREAAVGVVAVRRRADRTGTGQIVIPLFGRDLVHGVVNELNEHRRGAAEGDARQVIVCIVRVRGEPAEAVLNNRPISHLIVRKCEAQPEGLLNRAHAV